MKINSFFAKSEIDLKGKSRIPLLYVGTLYFGEGLPWVLVNLVSVLMYKDLGITNSQIGLYTSLFALPWMFKMFWGPLVDMISTKRTWLLNMQLICGFLFFIVALSVNMGSYFLASGIVFFAVAIISSTHDIAIDGYYMHSLSKRQQAFYVGIRSLFYNIAKIFGIGTLIQFVGILERDYTIIFSWTMAFVVCGVIFILLWIFHNWYLPHPFTDSKIGIDNDVQLRGSYFEFLHKYKKPFKQFFSQEKIFSILLFLFFYRFGEGVLLKMVPLFLFDPVESGGLSLSLEDIGVIQGYFGLIGLIIGGIFGGWMIARYGLRKSIWPAALILNLPNLLYVYLAFSNPGLTMVKAAITFEQFGYGVGFSAFMMFLITISKGENRTSLYAIATGLMAFGLMVPGMVSGFIQEWLGYQYFFIAATILTIPGMITLLFIPLENQSDSK